jgi:TonB family protein
VYSSPAIGSDGTVYVGSTDKKVYALDGETGTKQWEFETGGAVESSPAIGSDGTVYVGSIDEKLYAINGKSGVKLWEFRTGGAVESSPAIGNDGTVYVGSNDNKIYALDGETGTKQWEFETGGAVEASPAIGADGTVYVGSDDGKVYALATSSSGPAKSAWPMFGQNAQRTGRAIGQAETKRQAALNNPQTKLSGRTSVDVPLGRYASANYESFIRRKYMDATIHPGAISGDPVVKVRLVIARNGRILSARVTVKSGVASWDRSVQKALDRVKFIKPFPESMKGSQQTFNLNFNSRSFN